MKCQEADAFSHAYVDGELGEGPLKVPGWAWETHPPTDP